MDFLTQDLPAVHYRYTHGYNALLGVPFLSLVPKAPGCTLGEGHRASGCITSVPSLGHPLVHVSPQKLWLYGTIEIQLHVFLLLLCAPPWWDGALTRSSHLPTVVP